MELEKRVKKSANQSKTEEGGWSQPAAVFYYKEIDQWITASRAINTAVKEIGDFENWMKVTEYDCKSISLTSRTEMKIYRKSVTSGYPPLLMTKPSSPVTTTVGGHFAPASMKQIFVHKNNSTLSDPIFRSRPSRHHKEKAREAKQHHREATNHDHSAD
ncbi:hypothetical protein Dimus_017700 [Dionaea muscipula]